MRSVNWVVEQQPKISETEWFNHFKSVLGTLKSVLGVSECHFKSVLGVSDE